MRVTAGIRLLCVYANRKMAVVFNKFFGDVSLCNLCKSQKINQMVLWSLVESPNQGRIQKIQEDGAESPTPE